MWNEDLLKRSHTCLPGEDSDLGPERRNLVDIFNDLKSAGNDFGREASEILHSNIY
jgi:hypothetical protein